MVKHPEVQKRAQEEILRVMGSDRLPTFEDRDSLPYVESILIEVLRLRPPVSLGTFIQAPLLYPAVLKRAANLCSYSGGGAGRRPRRLPHRERHDADRELLVGFQYMFEGMRRLTSVTGACCERRRTILTRTPLSQNGGSDTIVERSRTRTTSHLDLADGTSR